MGTCRHHHPCLLRVLARISAALLERGPASGLLFSWGRQCHWLALGLSYKNGPSSSGQRTHAGTLAAAGCEYSRYSCGSRDITARRVRGPRWAHCEVDPSSDSTDHLASASPSPRGAAAPSWGSQNKGHFRAGVHSSPQGLLSLPQCPSAG